MRGGAATAGSSARPTGITELFESSVIKSDERVVFFPTYAAPKGAGRRRVDVHGWIFEPEDRSLDRRAALGLFRRALGLDGACESSAIFKRRAGLFIVDNESRKRLTLCLGGECFEAATASGKNGHFKMSLMLSKEQIDKWRTAGAVDADVLSVRAVTREDDGRLFEGRIHLPRRRGGMSVISDIDDTIKISCVTRKSELLRHTFLRPFEAAPGMAALYRRLAAGGAAFHYVTSSPWQLYEPLHEWMTRAGFPSGSMHMKDFRWKDRSFFNLFASSERFKPQVIQAILDDFPQRDFVLIGDSGENDPEIYGRIARANPNRVRHVFIRNVTGEAADSPRFGEAFDGLEAQQWVVGETIRDEMVADLL